MNITGKTSKSSDKITIPKVLFLTFAVAVYSSASIFSKLASGYDFLSLPYICSLGGVIIVMGIYAVLWQMSLKRVPLNQAYLFRSLGLVFGLVIAHLAFQELISWQNLLGAAIVLCGLLILLSEQ